MAIATIPYGSILKLVDYLYHDEEAHYEGMFDVDGNLLEGEDPEDHIFTHVERVARWLDDHYGDEEDEEPDPDPVGTEAMK